MPLSQEFFGFIPIPLSRTRNPSVSSASEFRTFNPGLPGNFEHKRSLLRCWMFSVRCSVSVAFSNPLGNPSSIIPRFSLARRIPLGGRRRLESVVNSSSFASIRVHLRFLSFSQFGCGCASLGHPWSIQSLLLMLLCRVFSVSR